MKRLYYHFYLMIVASLVVVVLVSVVVGRFIDHDGPSHRMREVAGELLALGLAAPDAPPTLQHDAVLDLASRLQTDLTLYDARRNRIAAAGPALTLPSPSRGGWHRGSRAGPAWVVALPDGRWLVARIPGAPRFADWRLAALLGAIALAVALAALPLARRVTRRVERL